MDVKNKNIIGKMKEVTLINQNQTISNILLFKKNRHLPQKLPLECYFLE